MHMHSPNGSSTNALHCYWSQKFLIFGKTGWIGGLLGEILTTQGAAWEFASARLEDRAAVIAEIERVRNPLPECCVAKASFRLQSMQT